VASKRSIALHGLRCLCFAPWIGFLVCPLSSYFHFLVCWSVCFGVNSADFITQCHQRLSL
jgi:hypothetical protein